MPRLYDATEGRVTLDGIDVRDIQLSSLRQVVATAFEDATLFSASVRENLTLGYPDATDDLRSRKSVASTAPPCSSTWLW